MLRADTAHRQQQGLASAPAAMQQDMKQRVVAKPFGFASEGIARAARVEDRAELFEHGAGERANGPLARRRSKRQLPDSPLKTLEPMAKAVNLV